MGLCGPWGERLGRHTPTPHSPHPHPLTPSPASTGCLLVLSPWQQAMTLALLVLRRPSLLRSRATKEGAVWLPCNLKMTRYDCYPNGHCMTERYHAPSEREAILRFLAAGSSSSSSSSSSLSPGIPVPASLALVLSSLRMKAGSEWCSIQRE